MVARTRTAAELEKLETHMGNAIEFATGVVRDAELRGLTGYDVAIAIAGVLAARNATLAGKVLVAVGDAIRAQPITKIFAATSEALQ